MRGRTGQAGPWPDGTSRLLACRKGGCVAARDEPVRGRTGQAALLRAARAEKGRRRREKVLIKLFQKFARCGAELHGLKRRSRKKAGRTAARARRAIGCPPVRVRDRTGQAGAWPHRTSRPLACRKGGCVAARDEPPSCVPQGRVRGRTGRAAFLRAARAGAWPHRTSRLLAYRKGGCVAARDKPPSCLPTRSSAGAHRASAPP